MANLLASMADKISLTLATPSRRMGSLRRSRYRYGPAP